MTSPKFLRDKINNFVKSLKVSDKLLVSKNSTVDRLINIINIENFDNKTNKEIDFFCKKFEISNKLFVSYDASGNKSTDKILGPEGLQIFVCLLYLRLLISIDQDSSEINTVKYINICWKAFDHVKLPDFLNSERERLKDFQDKIFKKFPINSLVRKTLAKYKITNTTKINHKKFKKIPIDILFYEGPIARSYLEMLHSLGCKPRRIINLIAKRDLVTQKNVGLFLPSFLRYKYAAKLQYQKIHHWPKYLFRTQKKLSLEVFQQLSETLKIEQNTLLGVLQQKPLKNYSDDVISLPIDSLKDQKLFTYLSQHNAQMYLYTGGGIMPESIFNIKNSSFIHIHPGYLPDIRGADCLLWSIMLAGYPSATSFFMNSGIDTGNIIKAVFLPKISLPIALSTLDKKMIYRLLYSFVDPWIRSAVLRDTLISTNYLENIISSPQNIEEGNTFHFMHENMISEVIKRLFK